MSDHFPIMFSKLFKKLPKYIKKDCIVPYSIEHKENDFNISVR